MLNHSTKSIIPAMLCLCRGCHKRIDREQLLSATYAVCWKEKRARERSKERERKREEEKGINSGTRRNKKIEMIEKRKREEKGKKN